MRNIDLQVLKSQHLWFLIRALTLLFLLTVGCTDTTNWVVEHRFSNIVNDQDTLWFGAGYKLYRVDLNQKTASLVYDAAEVQISFVQIDGERVIFGGSSDKNNVVWSLDSYSEKILWTHEFSRSRGFLVGSSGLSVSPLITSELLLVGEVDHLYALDKSNGDLKWTIDNNFFFELEPILINDQLVYSIHRPGDNGFQANRMLAIADPSSARTIKTISLPGYLGGNPAVHGNCFFIKEDMATDPKSYSLSEAHRILLNCLDFPSGKVIWSVEGSGYLAASRIGFYNGFVFDVFGDQVFAIDEQSGAILWKSQELNRLYKNPQVIENLDWIAMEASNSNKVIFLELMTGILLDNELVNLLSSPIFIGQEAIYGTTNALVRADIVTGNIIWSIPVDSHYLTRQSGSD